MKNCKKILLAFCCALALQVHAQDTAKRNKIGSDENAPEPKHQGDGTQYGDTYTNPLGPRIADPWMMKYGEFYYLYGTACPGTSPKLNWVPVWKSRDMIKWSGPYVSYRPPNDNASCLANEGYHYDGWYYNLVRPRGGENYLTRSKSPLGDYERYATLQTKEIDANIFVDTDGQSWVSTKNSDIWKLSADWKNLSDVKKAPFDEESNEGPFIIKNDNRYFIFRAFGQAGPMYQLMAGYAAAPQGSYTALENNPVVDGEFRPGHGGYSASPDGTEIWYAGHYYDKKYSKSWADRWLMIDKWGGFDTNGWPIKITQAVTTNPVPSRQTIHGNIAKKKFTNASGFKDENLPSFATDGNPETAWKANTKGSWLEVDMGGEYHVAGLRALFSGAKAWNYVIKGSYDRLNWQTLTDMSANAASLDTFEDRVQDSKYWRYIRIEVAGDAVGIREFEVLNDNTDQFLGYTSSVTIEAVNWSSADGLEKGDAFVQVLKKDAWAEYADVAVPESGVYDIEFRVATTTPESQWRLLANGKEICQARIGYTYEAEDWMSMICYDVPLQKGKQTFKMQFDDAGSNVKNIQLHRVKRNKPLNNK